MKERPRGRLKVTTKHPDLEEPAVMHVYLDETLTINQGDIEVTIEYVED